MKKRKLEDPGCFEDLIGIPPGTLTETSYEQRTRTAYSSAVFEYEAAEQGHPRRHYFVDGELVKVAANLALTEVVTCFHIAHEEGKHFTAAHRALATEADRILEFRRRFQKLVDCERIKGEVKLKGF